MCRNEQILEGVIDRQKLKGEIKRERNIQSVWEQRERERERVCVSVLSDDQRNVWECENFDGSN